jgi:2-polyprenyl-3-methyl-5-hydroxy-6-metoxy-1,4-benzoquinol methylase
MEPVTKNLEINEEKLNELLGCMLTEMGAAAMGPLVVLGDRLGFYKTLANQNAMTSETLAEKTNTNERYVREWLSAQAASGYVEYDKQTDKFYMSPEQIAVFADDDNPASMTGAYYSITSMYHDEPKIREVFQSGNGINWSNFNNCLFCGVEKFYGPTYKNSLINEWIPAIEGLQDKLTTGIKVADIGCGHGISTMVMAEMFPNSEFIGFDYHSTSIKHARKHAKTRKLNNANFETATAKNFKGRDFGLISFFDCLHDMGDPVGAVRHAKDSLKDEGICMVVEPFAHDQLHENFNPIGRAFYAFSTMICTPTSLSQEVALGLGAQAGFKKLKAVLNTGGFKHVKKVIETPFNLIIEARK